MKLPVPVDEVREGRGGEVGRPVGLVTVRSRAGPGVPLELGERPVRGKDNAPLIDWWRDHGHPNLLSADSDGVLVRAAIDTNILRDLTEAGRTNADESNALLADHLVGLLETETRDIKQAARAFQDRVNTILQGLTRPGQRDDRPGRARTPAARVRSVHTGQWTD